MEVAAPAASVFPTAVNVSFFWLLKEEYKERKEKKKERMKEKKNKRKEE